MPVTRFWCGSAPLPNNGDKFLVVGGYDPYEVRQGPF
jgi:hypothetical protein